MNSTKQCDYSQQTYSENIKGYTFLEKTNPSNVNISHNLKN